MAQNRPHPLNVPGDFYVVDGCCTMCEVPFHEAPGLFGACEDPRGYQHCYVKQQPETAGQLDQMVRAVQFAELQCIRYRGADRIIQLRLLSIGEGMTCDSLPSDLQQEAEQQQAARHVQWQTRPWWRFW